MTHEEIRAAIARHREKERIAGLASIPHPHALVAECEEAINAAIERCGGDRNLITFRKTYEQNFSNITTFKFQISALDTANRRRRYCVLDFESEKHTEKYLDRKLGPILADARAGLAAKQDRDAERDNAREEYRAAGGDTSWRMIQRSRIIGGTIDDATDKLTIMGLTPTQAGHIAVFAKAVLDEEGDT